MEPRRAAASCIVLLTCRVLLPAGALAADAAPPLVDLPFTGSLRNAGSLGGEATLTAHVPAEAAVFDEGPLGACLDFTAASRHGGAAGVDTSPAGSSVVFRNEKLAGLKAFSVVMWSRQAPGVEGVNARLTWADRGWDLTQAPRGFSVSIALSGSMTPFSFVTRFGFRDRVGFPAADEWRLTAFTVGSGTVRGFQGGLHRPPALLGEQPYSGNPSSGLGAVTIGNLGGIRPFKGWIGRFRVYDRPLSAAEVTAIHEADLAAAPKLSLPPPRPESSRPLVFKRSAIPFSTRWERPDALATMQSFHATDCLWVYGTKSEFVKAVQAAGMRYQGALSGLQGTDKASPGISIAGDTSGRHETFDGEKNMPSWMVTFKPPHYTGCCNQPAFRDLFFTAARQQLQIGADMLQVDDSAINASWVRDAAVCFCDACRSGFRDYLRRVHTPAELAALGVDSLDGFDYREHLKANGIPDAATYRKKFASLPLTPDFIAFQIESTRQFYRDFRTVLDEASPSTRVAISVNEGVPVAAADGRLFHADIVDFYHGEVYDRKFATSLAGNKSAEALGMQFVSTPVLLGTADGLRTLALAYATGQLHLVPWDIYMGSDADGSLPRYFGTREEFGAAYDLIHDHPELFDGAASMAEVGVLVDADVATKARVEQVCERLAARQVPFHLIAAATKQARIPLSEADLRGLRAVVAVSPLDSFTAEDLAVLDRRRADGRLRLVEANADLDSFLAAREMDILGWEGPRRVYLFPRASAAGPIIHVVNWNASADGRQPEVYRNVTVTLRHPNRWGPLGRITYHQPGEPAIDLQPEVHPDAIRITLPRLATWGILSLSPAAVALLVTPFQVRAPAAEPAPPRSVTSIHAMAEPLPEIPGAPRASAVCMRSLTARPAHKGDPHDTLAAIRGFHATRLEWTYGDDSEFIKKVHALGVEYGGALAAGSYVGKAPPIEWNVVGLDAQRLVPNWMRHWPRPNPWGCANNPEFAAGHVRAALAVVAAGADVIQRDEPEQNMLAVQWGGCLCRHCIAGFRAWLERNVDPQELAKAGVTDLASFDYAAHLRAKNAPSGDAFRRWAEGGLLRDYFRRFQLDASVAFHQRWRADLDKQAGRRIAVSCNNGARDWGPVRLPFDFCIGELAYKEATPTHLHECMRQARAHDRLQTITMPLKTVASPAEQESADWILLTRKSIATAYALGGLIEMPWDTFLPDAQRYFGKPERYADLTAFVRGIAPHLDGHAEAFATGCAVEDARWKGMTPPLALGDAAPHVLAVVRTLPDSPAAAAVIHLVDWRDEPQQFSITAQMDLFFGTEPATLRLLQPVAAYDRAAHDKAFDSRDYAPLVRSTPLRISADGTVAVPALAPWGVVIVEKQGKPH